MSSFGVDLVCETFSRPRAMRLLAEGTVLIFSGGTSHPGVTTDMCAAIRANDIGAGAVPEGHQGRRRLRQGPPHEHADAKRYDTLTLADAIAQRLGVMDVPAMAFCQDKSIPVVVFSMNEPGNCLRAARGEKVGTVVS